MPFTRADGSGLTPWADSNLSVLPQTAVAEIFHRWGGPFRGTAWGFHRDMTDGRIVPLDEFVLPGAGCSACRYVLRRTDRPDLAWMRNASHAQRARSASMAWRCSPRMRAQPMAVFGASRNGLFIAEWAARLGVPLLLCDAKPLKRSHLAEISLRTRVVAARKQKQAAAKARAEAETRDRTEAERVRFAHD